MTKGLGALWAACVMAAAFFMTGEAAAQEVAPPQALASVGPQPPVTAWNGSYTYSVPIKVPEFRGLEPKLKLSYDSARGIRNMPAVGGWLGVGWTLDGLSAIERVSGSAEPARDGSGKATSHKQSGGRGSPAYRWAYADGQLPKDSFMLDGDELIPCDEIKPSASGWNHVPSCYGFTDVTAAASGYATRVESYMRVRRQGYMKWTVTARDGTAYGYATFDAAPDVFRWYLTEAKDTKGNTVEYVYATTAGEDPVLTTIKYHNQSSTDTIAAINFYYEGRPDEISYASGNGLRWIKKRLKMIEVKFGGSPVRAYKLAYEMSPSTQLSRLASVQEVGLAGDSETALPATKFTYSDQSIGNFAQNPGNWAISRFGYNVVGDFNGDGRTDVVIRYDWDQRATNPSSIP